MMDPLFHIALRAFIAMIFAVAVVHKLRDWRRFRGVIENFAIAPRIVTPVLAVLAVAFEILAVTLLVAGPALMAGALAALLFAGYGGLIFLSIRRGKHSMDCGCSWVKSATLSYDYVLRNSLLTGAALLLFIQNSARDLMVIDVVNAVFFAVVATGAYFLLDALFHMKSLEAAR